MVYSERLEYISREKRVGASVRQALMVEADKLPRAAKDLYVFLHSKKKMVPKIFLYVLLFVLVGKTNLFPVKNILGYHLHVYIVFVLELIYGIYIFP